MSNYSIDSDYFHGNFGFVKGKGNQITNLQNDITYLQSVVQNYQDTINVTNETVHIGYNTENTNIILGNGATGTNTIINTEHMAVGQYIYMNKDNDSTGSEGGLIINTSVPNVADVPVYGSFTVKSNGAGFSGQTVELNQSTGLIPTLYVSIKGSKQNDGLYQVLTHVGGVLTISSVGPDYVSSSFNTESPSSGITVDPVSVTLIRGVDDTDWPVEIGMSALGEVSAKQVVYNTSAPNFKNLSLTDASNQLVLGSTTISSAGATGRSHSIKYTANDEFTMNIATQTLTNKTMTANTNNVISRGLWYGSGSNSVSTYASGTPTTGQVLTITGTNQASWVTPSGYTGSSGSTGSMTLQAGKSITLNGGKSDQSAGNISIAAKFDEEEEDPEETLDNPTESTNGEFPGVPSPGLGLPGIPGLPGITAAVVAAFAGVVVAGAFVGGVGAFGAVKTDDITGTTGATGPLSIHSSNGVTINGVLFGSTGSVSLDPLYVDNIYEKTAGGTGITIHDELVLKDVGSTDATDKILVLDSNDNVKYTSLGYIGGDLISVSIANNSIMESGSNVNIQFINNNSFVIMTVQGFEYTTTYDSNYISLGDCSLYNEDFSINGSIYVTIDSVWEECILMLNTEGNLQFFRKNLANFVDGTVIRHALDNYIGADKLFAQLSYFTTL